MVSVGLHTEILRPPMKTFNLFGRTKRTTEESEPEETFKREYRGVDVSIIPAVREDGESMQLTMIKECGEEPIDQQSVVIRDGHTVSLFLTSYRDGGRERILQAFISARILRQ